MFDEFYMQAPVDIECEHYTSTTPEIYKTGLPLIEALKDVTLLFADFMVIQDLG